MMSSRRVRLVAFCCLVTVFAAAGCRRWAGRNLLPVTLPELLVRSGVQTQVRERYDTLKAATDSSSTPHADLASASGSTGWCCRPRSSSTWPSPAISTHRSSRRMTCDGRTTSPTSIRAVATPTRPKRRSSGARTPAERSRDADLARTAELDKGKPAEAEQLFDKAYRSRRTLSRRWQAWAVSPSTNATTSRP